MVTKGAIFGVCNWLMVGIALAMCAYIFTDMFSSPPQSEGLSQQGQYRVSTPGSPVTSSPPGVEAKAVSALGPIGNASRPIQPAGSSGRNGASPISESANVPYPSPTRPPVPNVNRHLLPPGMENEDNALSDQPRPKK